MPPVSARFITPLFEYRDRIVRKLRQYNDCRNTSIRIASRESARTSNPRWRWVLHKRVKCIITFHGRAPRAMVVFITLLISNNTHHTHTSMHISRSLRSAYETIISRPVASRRVPCAHRLWLRGLRAVKLPSCILSKKLTNRKIRRMRALDWRHVRRQTHMRGAWTRIDRD